MRDRKDRTRNGLLALQREIARLRTAVERLRREKAALVDLAYSDFAIEPVQVIFSDDRGGAGHDGRFGIVVSDTRKRPLSERATWRQLYWERDLELGRMHDQLGRDAIQQRHFEDKSDRLEAVALAQANDLAPIREGRKRGGAKLKQRTLDQRKKHKEIEAEALALCDEHGWSRDNGPPHGSKKQLKSLLAEKHCRSERTIETILYGKRGKSGLFNGSRGVSVRK